MEEVEFYETDHIQLIRNAINKDCILVPITSDVHPALETYGVGVPSRSLHNSIAIHQADHSYKICSGYRVHIRTYDAIVIAIELETHCWCKKGDLYIDITPHNTIRPYVLLIEDDSIEKYFINLLVQYLALKKPTSTLDEAASIVSILPGGRTVVVYADSEPDLSVKIQNKFYYVGYGTSKTFDVQRKMLQLQFPHMEIIELTKTCWFCCKSSSKKCGRCLIARYCSVECQKLDWNNHRKICKN